MKQQLKKLFGLSLAVLLLSSCIGDDFIDDQVEPTLRIVSMVNSIAIGESFQIEAIYFNNIGVEEEAIIEWSSSNEDIISVDDNGLVSALQEGMVTLFANVRIDSIEVSDSIELVSSTETNVDLASASGIIRTTSSYVLRGDFEVQQEEGGIRITIADNYVASSSLPGLYLYLTNNSNSIANALEVTKVTVFNGEHSYFISDVELNQYQYLLYYCKPFNVKVGDGKIEL